jgi:hypothetical protein
VKKGEPSKSRRLFFVLPKEFMADFAKQLHEFIELGDNIYTVPIFMCESFIESPTPLAMLVFDGSENEPEDEELN